MPGLADHCFGDCSAIGRMRTADEDEFSARRAANSLENVLAVHAGSAEVIEVVDAGASTIIDHARGRRFRPDLGKNPQATRLQILDLSGDNFSTENHRSFSAIGPVSCLNAGA